MAIAPVPHLLIDIGGTLIHRDKPGAKGRVIDWLARHRRPFDRREGRLSVARAVLTARDPEAAARAVARAHGLSPSETVEILRLLTEDDGSPHVLEGAAEILAAARKHGWRVIYATNACGWSAPLPDSLLRAGDITVSSAELGILKDEPAFWRKLVADFGIDPRFALAVGDSEPADVIPARAAGLAAMLVGGGDALPSLAAAIDAAGPIPQDAVGIAAGLTFQWGGCSIIEAANLTPLVERTTRTRLRLYPSSSQRTAVLIRRSDCPPALVAEDGETLPIVSWALPCPDQRMRVLPSDLAEALQRANIDAAAIDADLRRQLVAMVKEARDPEVRRVRIVEIVDFLAGRRIE
ncbi:HAD family hydrolase [Sorangium sp. So ce388]|uniref:HAD family hydrolase n=1 Tax=Sorangium sp. So ce388 TaxID=3133309 RepID=UPI003F5BC22F